MSPYITLLAVALGSALTLLGGFALERKREAAARAVKLRDSYSRWLALQFGAVVDLEEFFHLAETVPQRDQAYLERLEARLGAFRPNISAIFELSFTISSIEEVEKLREAVRLMTDQLRLVYSLAHFTATAHGKAKHQDGLLVTLANSLENAPDSEKESPAFERAQEFLASNRALQDGKYLPALREQQEHSAKALIKFKEVLEQVAQVVRGGG